MGICVVKLYARSDTLAKDSVLLPCIPLPKYLHRHKLLYMYGVFADLPGEVKNMALDATTQTVLWIGTALMTIGLLVFIYMTYTTSEENRHFYYATSLVPLIAASAYFAMATGHGAMTIGGHTFFFARYIDWVFTTPLLLLDLALLALANVRRRIALVGVLLGADVYMIITGLIAGLLTGADKYVWFATSTIAFLFVLFVLVRMFREAQVRGGAISSLFRNLATLTIVLWICYPIVWLLGTEGTGLLSIQVEVILYMILDVLAKVGFGFLLLSNRAALSESSRATVSSATGD